MWFFWNIVCSVSRITLILISKLMFDHIMLVVEIYYKQLPEEMEIYKKLIVYNCRNHKKISKVFINELYNYYFLIKSCEIYLQKILQKFKPRQVLVSLSLSLPPFLSHSLPFSHSLSLSASLFLTCRCRPLFLSPTSLSQHPLNWVPKTLMRAYIFF